jgi:hypothetical protein
MEHGFAEAQFVSAFEDARLAGREPHSVVVASHHDRAVDGAQILYQE